MNVEVLELKTAITAIKYLKHLQLTVVAIGNTIEFYQNSFRLHETSSLTIFPGGSIIHGFHDIDESIFLVWGGRRLSLAKYQKDGNIVIVKSKVFEEWIHDVIYHLSNIIVLTAYNRSFILNVSLDVKEITNSSDNSILYSGLIVSIPNSHQFILMGGTVFKEIHIRSSSNDIFHRLCGHEGVIFSISFNGFVLCSTSDDRTARLWSCKASSWKEWTFVKIFPTFILKDVHSSRIFKSCFYKADDDVDEEEEDKIILGGEDSLCSVWSVKSGQLLGTYGEEAGASIWSLECVRNTIIVGYGDCTLKTWPTQFPTHIDKIRQIDGCHDPRSLLFYDEDLIVVSSEGKVFRNYVQIFQSHHLVNYSVIKTHNNYLIIGSLHGFLFVIELTSNRFLFSQQISCKKILTFLSLDDFFLINTFPSTIQIYRPVEFSESIYELQLPMSFSAKDYSITCGVKSGNLLILGDRNGSLHVYDLTTQQMTPFQTLFQIHGKRGVGDICLYSPTLLGSIGRDGKIRTFILSTKIGLEANNVFSLQFNMCERIVVNKKNGSYFLLGFHSSDLLIYDIAQTRILKRIPCGGSHRSWDFMFKDSTQDAVFAFINKKQIHISTIQEKDLLCCSIWKSRFHTREINTVKAFSFSDQYFFASGSEDTLLRIQDIQFSQFIECKTHLSNILCLDVHTFNNTTFIVSGGGRAEIILWKFNLETHFSTLKCEYLTSFLLKGNDKQRQKSWKNDIIIPDVETRFTDIALFTVMDVLYVLVAGSDAVLRLLSFQNSKMNLINETKNESHCIQKVIILSSAFETQALSASTNGSLTLWNLSKGSLEFVSRIDNVHQSGINAIDSIKREEIWEILCGGDDTSISVLQVKDNFVKRVYLRENAHAAQITGLKYLDSVFAVSTSVDQRIVIWNTLLSLKLIHIQMINIADIHELDIVENKIIVVGQGAQILSIQHHNHSSPQ